LKSCCNPDLLNSELDAHPWAWPAHVSQNKANHYFSPRKFASANRAREILDSLRLSLPTVAPGQTPGALRFVSLALHILPQKGGRHRRNVSARKFPNLLHPETHFSSL
jgi:hypothetical protein